MPIERIGEAEIPLFSKEHCPIGDWRLYQKKVPTSALRIKGPFRVATSETENEPFLCQDGYLCIDARGYPYAVAKEEFDLIYGPVVG